MASVPALADNFDFGKCQSMFANGQVPILKQAAALRPRALCFSGFAVLHSGVRHTPVFVVQRLNRARIEEARDNERTNRFYEEARLPSKDRAELEDYAHSGYDRGHMAPAADMAGPEAMAQSFSLANMVPQAPVNNRKTWAALEKANRKYVLRASGDVFVITAPVYKQKPHTIGPNQVWVPDALFKLVYDADTKRAWAYWLGNTDTAQMSKPISYEELVKKTGVQWLPGVKIVG